MVAPKPIAKLRHKIAMISSMKSVNALRKPELSTEEIGKSAT
jgi:hypothetical protein